MTIRDLHYRRTSFGVIHKNPFTAPSSTPSSALHSVQQRACSQLMPIHHATATCISSIIKLVSNSSNEHFLNFLRLNSVWFQSTFNSVCCCVNLFRILCCYNRKTKPRLPQSWIQTRLRVSHPSTCNFSLHFINNSVGIKEFK